MRQQREALKLTQVELAEIAHMPQFHISRIETGDIKDVKGDTIRRLARALRVSADWLLEIDDVESEPLAILAG